ncbi:hypothetical protein [Streptomyces seoulensis]|uniref:hypothetical protein n=1 Tax=Streptomyces seoulensis TaxID=73044 RepID=UPI001FCB3EB4|nr:hypothetical protein [Streptomyces seoulensis]BDH07178.1 hypothetical protein HEK131_44050 [Streptomyces seoulensis]
MSASTEELDDTLPDAGLGDEEAVEDEEPVYASGPEGEIDQKADEEGWAYDDRFYDSASAFVQDICDSLPDQAENSSPGQWLAEAGEMDDDGAAMLKFGVPKLCPKWTDAVQQAASGTYERYISGGDYEVKTHPKALDQSGAGGVQEIGPGTYVASGHFSDCYWERTAADGTIIANQFVTQATKLTVTLHVGELFRQECGTFKPVG